MIIFVSISHVVIRYAKDEENTITQLGYFDGTYNQGSTCYKFKVYINGEKQIIVKDLLVNN